MSLFKKFIVCVLLLCAQGVLVAQEQINHNTVIVEQAVSEENNAQETKEKQSFYKARRRKKKKQWSMRDTALVSGGAGGLLGFAASFSLFLFLAVILRFGPPIGIPVH